MRYLILLCCAAMAFGQTDPKKKVEEYEAHAQARIGAIGAEYMVHSFSRGEQVFLAKDFLVVEVAVFPRKGETIEVMNGQFTLRINGKTLVKPQSPQMVAASLVHTDWEEQRQGATVGARTGDIGVIFGGPPRSQPIPGSNPPGSEPPNRIPAPRDNPGGYEKKPVKAEQLVLETAMPEGPRRSAVSGFVYFPYKGKAASLKTVELLYEDSVLKLK